jgi:hypothetical protein
LVRGGAAPPGFVQRVSFVCSSANPIEWTYHHPFYASTVENKQ